MVGARSLFVVPFTIISHPPALPLRPPGSFVFSAKPGRLEKVVAYVDTLLADNHCTAAESAVLRGQAAFIGSQLHGMLLRFADGPLIRRQCAEARIREITPQLGAAFCSICAKLSSACLPR